MLRKNAEYPELSRRKAAKDGKKSAASTYMVHRRSCWRLLGSLQDVQDRLIRFGRVDIGGKATILLTQLEFQISKKRTSRVRVERVSSRGLDGRRAHATHTQKLGLAIRHSTAKKALLSPQIKQFVKSSSNFTPKHNRPPR